jgi:hypothetical protein
MSQSEQDGSAQYEKDMSTSKSSSMLRLNQEGRRESADWQDHGDTDSEVSENDFLTKGAFLLTPSHELSMEKAATICEKMNFR